jgi:hypothetical protein
MRLKGNGGQGVMGTETDPVNYIGREVYREQGNRQPEAPLGNHNTVFEVRILYDSQTTGGLLQRAGMRRMLCRTRGIMMVRMGCVVIAAASHRHHAMLLIHCHCAGMGHSRQHRAQQQKAGYTGRRCAICSETIQHYVQ